MNKRVIIISKAQDQTFPVCDLDLDTPCFSHGQFYVSCSRVGKSNSLFGLDKDQYADALIWWLFFNYHNYYWMYWQISETMI